MKYYIQHAIGWGYLEMKYLHAACNWLELSRDGVFTYVQHAIGRGYLEVHTVYSHLEMTYSMGLLLVESALNFLGLH